MNISKWTRTKVLRVAQVKQLFVVVSQACAITNGKDLV
jgi:hypothetical protein